MGESTTPRRSSPLEGQKTTAIEHSGPTLNTSARHFALERALHDGAALHLAAQVAEGREDALLLFRGRDDSVGKVLSKGVVRRRKKVRRAKLFYLRSRTGKAAKVKARV